jgi:hypothetical protein
LSPDTACRGFMPAWCARWLLRPREAASAFVVRPHSHLALGNPIVIIILIPCRLDYVLTLFLWALRSNGIYCIRLYPRVRYCSSRLVYSITFAHFSCATGQQFHIFCVSPPIFPSWQWTTHFAHFAISPAYWPVGTLWAARPQDFVHALLQICRRYHSVWSSRGR